MVPFGGFVMPLQYTAILEEHAAARHGAAIFDTCHMGQIGVEGPAAPADLEHLVSCDIAPIAPGQCRYGLLCNTSGGVLDDLVVYRLDDTRFRIVVNASTQDGDLAWIRSHVSGSTRVVRHTPAEGKLDLQGPASPAIADRLLERSIRDLAYYRFHANRFRGSELLVSRTGYTGEIGFEFYGAAPTIAALWDAAIAAGATPAGLAARDTLRLEMGMPLYGHELSADRNAAESGFHRACSRTKSFIGADAIRNADPNGRRLAGLRLRDRRAARAGDAVRRADGSDAGIVTSGSFAPSLGVAVALAYLDGGDVRPGSVLGIAGRQVLEAEVVPTPFHAGGTARRPMSEFLPPASG
jgi:aminomethyltransferase